MSIVAAVPLAQHEERAAAVRDGGACRRDAATLREHIAVSVTQGLARGRGGRPTAY